VLDAPHLALDVLDLALVFHGVVSLALLHHKLGPTSGVGQCLARYVSQGAKEWSDVDHQDVLMCPRQQSEGDVTSDIGDSNSRTGPREMDPRPYTSYQ